MPISFLKVLSPKYIRLKESGSYVHPRGMNVLNLDDIQNFPSGELPLSPHLIFPVLRFSCKYV